MTIADLQSQLHYLKKVPILLPQTILPIVQTVQWAVHHVLLLGYILKMTTITIGLNLVLLGKTGAGKSATGNTILGRQAFISKKSSKSITRDVAVESGAFFELPVHVYDTPGFFDTELKEQDIQLNDQNLFQRCESGPCVFLLVIKADRFTQEERKTVERIEKLLGPKRLEKTWILFTRGDELVDENMTIHEFLEDTEPLKKLVQKYDQRFHVFNNKTKEDREQVKMLLAKILRAHLDTVVEADPLKRKTPVDAELLTPVSSLSSRRIILLGKIGVGKSASGNTLLGQKEFASVLSMSSVTCESSAAHAIVSGRSVSVVDTPGLFNTKMNPEELAVKIAESVYISSPGPHAFLIVFPVNMRFSEHEQQIPQIIEMMFGQEVLKYSIILFTHGDLLEEKTVKDLIERNFKLRGLVHQCGGRYHVLNNKDQNNREQVNKLLHKIDTMIEQNGGGHYSYQMFEDAQRFRQEEKGKRKQPKKKQIQDIYCRRFASRRIILLGKIGVGKSASGNTILGQKEFASVLSMSSVTCESSAAHAIVSGRSVSVVDTPGLFDTKMNPEELAVKIAESIYISSPGPHAFLIVFPLNIRFTKHEQQIPQIIEMMFGQEVLKYSIILFTHGDLLEEKTVEDLIKENCKLRDLVDQCGGRYHVFNNKDQNNREQVNKLMQKIDRMIEQNGGGHYSNQMFEDAERFRQEEEERRQREEDERKQQMEKQKQEEIERVRKETEKRTREEIKAEQKRWHEEQKRKQEEWHKARQEEDSKSNTCKIM